MENQSAYLTFIESIPSIVSLILSAFLGLLFGILFEKIKNRVNFLRYTIDYQPIATSSESVYWGNIKVFHNDIEIKHLSSVTLFIENFSSNDFTDIIIDTACNDNSYILGQNGFYNIEKNVILLEPKYLEYFNDVLLRNQLDVEEKSINYNHETPIALTQEIDWLLKNKRFFLPVLNRKSSVTINFLIANQNGQTPTLLTSVLHKSIKLIKKADESIEQKKTLIYTLIFGLLIFIAGIAIILLKFPESVDAIVFTAVLGTTYSLIGLLLYKFIAYLRRLLI